MLFTISLIPAFFLIIFIVYDIFNYIQDKDYKYLPFTIKDYLMYVLLMTGSVADIIYKFWLR